MIYRTMACVALLIGSVANAQRTMTCEPLVGQGQEKEVPYLKLAPHGASRPAKHRLAVRWAKGVREFADKAPYMEDEEDGSRFLYCGFDPELSLHLIYKIDEASSRGVLLDDATGRVLPAGETVIFSGDFQRYFASVQPEGLDGNEWHVYSRDGTEIWKGLSGISAKHPTLGYDYFIATLESPRWSAANELEATLKCASGDTTAHTVMLRPVKGGYNWSPAVHCPPAK